MHYALKSCCENPAFHTERVVGATRTRSELDRLLQDMRAGKVERVVVKKLDRLGRNLRNLTHLANAIDEMSRLRVPLVASSQGLDTSEENPAGPPATECPFGCGGV